MMSNNTIFKNLIACVQFLSRLPIPDKMADHDKPDFSKCTRMFPVAGFLIALPAVGAMALLHFLGIPALVIAATVIAIQLTITGALHEDGLADCADGFGGGRDRDSKLKIMKDSRVGAYGVVVTIMAVVLRFALFGAFLDISLVAAILAFLAAQTLSRSVQVYFWQSLPPARPSGLAGSLGQPDTHATHWALAIGIISALTLTSFAFKALSVLIGFIMTISALYVFYRLCKKQINGQTGDTIGAIQIISEIAFLLGLTTFSI